MAMSSRIRARRAFGMCALILAGFSESKGQDSLSNVFGVSAGMGITVVRATDVVDYINGVVASNPKLDDFASTVEFFGTAEFRLSESWGAKLEYAYLIKSYTMSQGGSGTYEYFYAVHMPTISGQYLDVHPGYAFKFGAGIGYHFANFSEQLQGASSRDLLSNGIGIKFEAEGNTALGDRLFAFLAGDIRFDFMSVLRDSQGNTLQIQGPTPKEARMNFLALGLKLGIIYYF